MQNAVGATAGARPWLVGLTRLLVGPVWPSQALAGPVTLIWNASPTQALLCNPRPSANPDTDTQRLWPSRLHRRASAIDAEGSVPDHCGSVVTERQTVPYDSPALFVDVHVALQSDDAVVGHTPVVRDRRPAAASPPGLPLVCRTVTRQSMKMVVPTTTTGNESSIAMIKSLKSASKLSTSSSQTRAGATSTTVHCPGPSTA